MKLQCVSEFNERQHNRNYIARYYRGLGPIWQRGIRLGYLLAKLNWPTTYAMWYKCAFLVAFYLHLVDLVYCAITKCGWPPFSIRLSIVNLSRCELCLSKLSSACCRCGTRSREGWALIDEMQEAHGILPGTGPGLLVHLWLICHH